MNESEWERSRTRWRKAPGDWEDLTWGEELTGDAFVEIVQRYVDFGPETTILEIGPGYGRLLKACLDKGIRFGRYCGLDISEDTCVYLRGQFPFDNVSFMHGDVESASFEDKFDVVLSSATLQHLYPSMEKALEHLRTVVSQAGLFCIDVPEGTSTWFEDENDTFIHQYAKQELLEILGRVGLEHVAFEDVAHAPDIVRLLTVARNP